MPLPNFAVLSCDVFTEELKEIAGDSPAWRGHRELEMGLHDNPPKLREQIQGEISILEEDSEIEAIALAYGRCGNGLIGVKAERCQLVIAQAHDCISILLGSREKHDAVLKENPGTYFYSPGWVRGKRVPGPDREAHLRELYGERFEDDEEMIDELVEADQDAFAHHNCAAYVSIIERPEAASYCEGCAQHLSWEHKPLQGDPSFLTDLLKGNWEQNKFLIVQPGQTIGADTDGNLIAKD